MFRYNAIERKMTSKLTQGTWFYHGPFKKHLSLNPNDNLYYIVEEYDTKKFQIISFKNADNFIRILQGGQNGNNIIKSYYNIFFNNQRHLYLDFDIYLKYEVNDDAIFVVGKEIVRILVNFYNIHPSCKQFKTKSLTSENFYIFSSSRSVDFKSNSKQFRFKISLHIYCCHIIFDNLTLLKNHVSCLKQFVNSHVNLFKFPSDILHLAASAFEFIDESVYKNIQYFRCFQSSKYGDCKSVKRLIYPKHHNGTISYTKMIKIMQVDKPNKNEIHIHYKDTSPSLVEMIDKDTMVIFENTKYSKISNASKYLIYYNFAATNNNLRWKEQRIYKDGSLVSIDYFSTNSCIKYPRLFVKLSGLTIKQIQELDMILKMPDIKIQNTYKSLFTHFKYDISQEIEYYIYFNEDNISFHNHTPSCIKKYSTSGISKYQGQSFSIYCRNCKKWNDIFNE